MEIAYLMVGKRFIASDVEHLNSQLTPLNLVTNLETDGSGNWSVRRVSEQHGTSRYAMNQTLGNSADVKGYDVVIGKEIGNNRYLDIVKTDLPTLEGILNEVKEDIPDAKIIASSYWS